MTPSRRGRRGDIPLPGGIAKVRFRAAAELTVNPSTVTRLCDQLLAALPPGQHELVIAAFRAFAAAAGELPQPGAALCWAGR